ncbi:hypothetical protein LEP48_13930 [Isoptericola sp. NEAU-Y5]|uniref:Uncharacterized protein n=1 Tax=Isoptericola luteus TaxID=2879484 RepID=A0ABS7ZHE8_9MICO|nr:hypothetical protein [Isoptericola sp. NEAU-Y5]MCA5894437.1 hypothetical protein [Isoptericola sp. NEAU-Y5]
MHPRRRWPRAGTDAAAAGALALGVLALGSCTPDAEPALPDDVAGGLRVELRQDRTQYADRTAALKVVNGSDASLTLLGGSLSAPGFGPSAPDGEPRARPLAPGSSRDVRIRLGEVDCATAPDAATATATVRVAVEAADDRVDDDRVDDDRVDGDGGGTEVEVPVTDPFDRLATVHAQVCAERLVATGVRLQVSDVRPRPVAGDDGEEAGLRILLDAEPVPGGPTVRIVRISGTTLLAPVSGASAWTGALVEPGAGGRVALDALPARCDPHAVGEDKRGTFLPVVAAVDGVEQPVVYVPMDDGQRAATYDAIHDACGWA